MRVLDAIASKFRGDLNQVRAKNEEQDKQVREALEAARRERLRMILEIRSHR